MPLDSDAKLPPSAETEKTLPSEARIEKLINLAFKREVIRKIIEMLSCRLTTAGVVRHSIASTRSVVSPRTFDIWRGCLGQNKNSMAFKHRPTNAMLNLSVRLNRLANTTWTSW